MKRNDFIRTSGIALAGIAILPHLSFTSYFEGFTRDQLLGKGNPDIIGDTYTSKIHKEAKEAFDKMKVEAAKENINLEVVSGYRTFQRQKEIYEGKYRRFIKEGLSPENAIVKIIEYSTIPGTSRHHWGTDLDMIDANAPRPANLLLAENYHGLGAFCKLKMWMDENSEKFGFFEVYTNNGNRKGFKYEPWHFSYAPVSIPMLKAYIEQINVKEMLAQEKILGNEYFTADFISKYFNENIMDINPSLK